MFNYIVRCIEDSYFEFFIGLSLMYLFRIKPKVILKERELPSNVYGTKKWFWVCCAGYISLEKYNKNVYGKKFLISISLEELRERYREKFESGEWS